MMAYVIGGKILFEHVPKTGGKALLDAFALCDDLLPVALQATGQHVGHARREQVTDKRFTLPRFRFGIVRDPAGWWTSLWKYVETDGCGLFDIGPGVGHPFRPIMRWIKRGLRCSDFVSEIVHKADGFYSAMVADYLGKADLIGRFDNLGPAALAACRLSGIKLTESERMILGSPRRVNVSAPAESAGLPILAADVVQQVNTIEARGLEVFSRAGVYTKTGEPVPAKKRGR